MSEVVANVNEQNSAQSKATAPSTELNNVECAVKAVPEAVQTLCSANSENADGSELKQDAEKLSTSLKAENKNTPGKRTPSKRMSFIERAQRESEELVKNMGGSLEIEGGRRTRSSTRGTPTRSVVASTPPPTKKARTSPTSGASTPTRPRGRGRKIETADDGAEEDETEATPNKKKTPEKGKSAASKDGVENEEMEEKVIESNDAEKKLEETKKNVTDSTVSNRVANESTEAPQGDEIDSVLEPVLEETQSQVVADSLSTEAKNLKNSSASVENIDEIVKSDSPMETEDEKAVESVTEKNKSESEEVLKTAVEALQEAKEPTPEPMEVDSSSKSNDALEKMEDDVVELTENAEVVQKPIKFVANQPSAAVSSPAIAIELLNSVENTECIKENSLEGCAIAPTAGLVANNSITKPPANDVEITSYAANDLNKPKNDLCEPKIATSPPISAASDNSSVTTPQTCK